MNGKMAQHPSLHVGPSSSSASRSNIARKHDKNIESGAAGSCDSAATELREKVSVKEKENKQLVCCCTEAARIDPSELKPVAHYHKSEKNTATGRLTDIIFFYS